MWACRPGSRSDKGGEGMDLSRDTGGCNHVGVAFRFQSDILLFVSLFYIKCSVHEMSPSRM